MPAPHWKNLATQRFGRLLVIAPLARNHHGQWIWLTVCDCGTPYPAIGPNVSSGNTTSCGCFQRDWTIQRHRQHGKTHTTIYNIYAGIVQRCTNPKNKGFPNYGGRGITCEFTSFEEFYAEVGDRPGPGYTIDRIDNHLPYQKGNLRWATRKEQMNNMRRNHRLTFQGETRTMVEWERHLNMPRGLLHNRFRAGWTVERALTTVVQVRHMQVHNSLTF